MGVIWPWVYRSRASYAEEQAYRRRSLEERLAILEVLVLATSRGPEVMEVIAASADRHAAGDAVRDLLGAEEPGAAAVLDSQLRRFSQDALDRLIQDRDEIRELLAAASDDWCRTSPGGYGAVARLAVACRCSCRGGRLDRGGRWRLDRHAPLVGSVVRLLPEDRPKHRAGLHLRVGRRDRYVVQA